MATQSVAVIGNGIIGHGIAEVFAKADWRVTLIGRSAKSLDAATAKIGESLAMFASHGLVSEEERLTALSRITTTTELDDAKGVDFVIEAVPEDMALKRAIFERLEAICSADAVLASSSGHLVSELVESGKGKRVVAAHFWYPPQLIPLVEVCGGPATTPAVLARTCEILKAVGKEPVVIDKEVPGFIGNRIQFAALREAWSLWASGVASAEAIDAVVRNSIGRRLGVTGPLESADVGGLDTMVAFARFLQPSLDAKPLPPPVLDRLVAEGHRGLPSGRGVYDWSRRDGASLLAARREELIRWLKADRVSRRSSTPS
ncbi:MAG: 3-hydroxyacyl-CoA dehydrogenase family protein [Hyphomicrobiales bacterium]|nr:3-hydroxyacyl-CoA dehydrogenase family protein [Hyphomicrobiales bacterium]MBV9115405.1 3-hydroxyacyl-CoA dehydrogenase family protein [Hyphomicrobiales bacterium]MBV9519619.1 3-hydroxyacyl-CoA dehydrogenase family protein [Hyphomicrobiales bacterium]